jgi:hypothetical protein
MPSIYKTFKAWLSFTLEQNPRIEIRRPDFRQFIPQPYEGVVIISADFELAWAWRLDKRSADPLKLSLDLARKERENLPRILDLCDKFDIPITWGTVGHLFLEHCQRQEGKAHTGIQRIPHFENEWWKYASGDWFDSDPCSSFAEAPEWYAPDLIRKIIDSKAGHEIGCHTFSHISCSDGSCPPEVLRSELEATRLAAAPFGIEPESFIFPGHTMGNYDTLKEAGYTSMRTNFINVLGYPSLLPNGLWEHKTTMELYYNRRFTKSYNLKRYEVILNKCIHKNMVCNLWFHPSFDTVSIEKILPSVFAKINKNRKKLWVTTMKEYTAWLNAERQKR